jgi:DNA-binding MarR family transcriptional regulator
LALTVDPGRLGRTLNPPPSFYDVRDTAAFAVGGAYRALRAFLGPERRELGLDEGRDLVLLEVGRLGGRATSKDLRELLGMSRGSLSAIVRRAEAAGYVRRVRDPANGRVVRIMLTDAGRVCAIGAASLWREADSVLASSFGSTNVEWLRDLALDARSAWLAGREESEAAALRADESSR